MRRACGAFGMEIALHNRCAAGCAMVSLSLAILLPSLGNSITNVGLPFLIQDFGASFAAGQWVVLAFLLATTTLIVSAGRLGDLVGRRALLLGGMALFTLASAVCGAAPDLAVLIGGRAAQGIGAAFMLALSMAFVGDLVPKEGTGRAMGLLAAMSSIGTTLGPALGGLLIAAFGWRAIFWINVPPGLIAGWLAWRHLPAARPAARRGRPGFDGVGTVLLGLTLGAYALAMTGRSGISPGLVLAACGGLGAFLWFERRHAAPLLDLRMFRDVRLSASLVMSVMVASTMMATLVVVPFYLSRVLGLSAESVGLLMSLGPLVTAFTSLLVAGRMADRFGSSPAVLVGLGLMAIGAFGFAWTSAGIAGYAASSVILGFGYALFQTANSAAVMAHAAPERRGVTSGLLNLSRNIGLITGASVMAALFAMTGMSTTFLVAGALCAVALAIAAVTRADGAVTNE